MLGMKSDVFRGHDELRSLFAMLAERKLPVRQYYRTPYLTDMSEQMDFAAVMDSTTKA